MTKPCVFCGKPATSKEDIIPKWISRMMEWDPSIDVKYQLQAQFAGEWKRGGLWGSIYLVSRNRICTDCNTGWMSTLQKEAAPILRELLAGHRVHLMPDALNLVAGWVTMIAMVASCVLEDESRWYFTETERSRFRTHGAIPEVTTLWLAHCPRELGHLSRPFFGVGTSFKFVKAIAPDFILAPAHVVSLNLLQAVFQLLVYRLPAASTHPRFFRKPSVEEPWLDMTVRWSPPDEQGPFDWPPPKPIWDDLALAAFTRRWTPQVDAIESATPQKPW